MKYRHNAATLPLSSYHKQSIWSYECLFSTHNFKSSHLSTSVHRSHQLSREYEVWNESSLKKSKVEIRMPAAGEWWYLGWSAVAESSATDRLCRSQTPPACWHCMSPAARSLLAVSAWCSHLDPRWPWRVCDRPSAGSCWGRKGRRVRGRSRSWGQWWWQLRQFCLD